MSLYTDSKTYGHDPTSTMLPLICHFNTYSSKWNLDENQICIKFEEMFFALGHASELI